MTKHVRPPLDIRQEDKEDCVVCMTEQVRYVWGLTNRPNVKRLSRRLGRKSGMTLASSDAHYFLLEQGFSILVMSDWEEDRFLREGEAYLRRYYRQQPDGDREYRELKKRYSIVELIKMAQNDDVRYRKYEKDGRYRHIPRLPDKTDVRRLLRSGWTLDVSLYDPEEAPEMNHAGLLVPHSRFRTWRYWPEDRNYQGNTVELISMNNAFHTTKFRAGITALRLP